MSKKTEKRKDTRIVNIEDKRIDRQVKKEADEESHEALHNLIRRFTDDTLTGK